MDRHARLEHALARFAEGLALAEERARIPVMIAGVRLDLLTSSSHLEARIREYFADYLSPGGSPAGEIRLEAYSAPLEDPRLWEDEDPEFHIRGDLAFQRDFVARLADPLGGIERAVALVSPELDDAIHNLLRWFFPKLLLRASGFLLHGAGIVRDGNGYVFFGQSGAGKSTSVSLAMTADPLALPLGDDSVIIQFPSGQGIPWVQAAPLGSGYSRLAPPRVSAPLAGLFALEQDVLDRIEPLSPSQGVAALLASAMNVRPDDSPEERFDLARRFADSACGIARLRFTRSAEFWRALTGHTKPEQRRDAPDSAYL